jgi:hypothetical protein
MAAFLIVLTCLFVASGAALFARMLKRSDSWAGLLGFTAFTLGGIVAVFYGGITSG